MRALLFTASVLLLGAGHCLAQSCYQPDSQTCTVTNASGGISCRQTVSVAAGTYAGGSYNSSPAPVVCCGRKMPGWYALGVAGCSYGVALSEKAKDELSRAAVYQKVQRVSCSGDMVPYVIGATGESAKWSPSSAWDRALIESDSRKTRQSRGF
jgi:hypothetical protein